MVTFPENAKNANELKVERESAPNIPTVKESVDALIQITTFKMFRERFREALQSRHFGEKGESVTEFDGRHSMSAGAKELERSGARKLLLNPVLLRSLHELLREYARLTKKQEEVINVSVNTGKKIREVRNAKKTLRSMKSRLLDEKNPEKKERKTLYKQLENILGPENLRHLEQAWKELTIVEDALTIIERILASEIHPALRRKHDEDDPKNKWEVSKLVLLLRTFDQKSLKKRAPQAWLIKNLNRLFRNSFQRANTKVSDITRFRIIASVVQAGGLEPIEPDTIKEKFEEAKRARLKSARNSPGT